MRIEESESKGEQEKYTEKVFCREIRK